MREQNSGKGQEQGPAKVFLNVRLTRVSLPIRNTMDPTREGPTAKIPLSEGETISLAENVSGHRVAVAGSDPMLQAISVPLVGWSDNFLSLVKKNLAAPDRTRRDRGGSQTGSCSPF